MSVPEQAAGSEADRPHSKRLGVSDNYCDYPFSSIHVATDGSVSPCCEYAGSVGNVKSASLATLWSGPGMAAIRESFKADERPEACWKCFQLEESEGASLRTKRLRAIETSADANRFSVCSAPRMVDIRFSNLCNLRCRTCGPQNSSKWYKDALALGYSLGEKAEIKSFPTLGNLIEQFSEWVDHIEYIYFAGGEPLLIEDHYIILELLIKRGRTSVNLIYTTNMTVLACHGRSIIDLWSHFPNVLMEASVDGVGARGGLIRKDFVWDKFVSHVSEIRQKCPHVAIVFGVTVSIFNILTLTELLEVLRRDCGATAASFFLHSLQEPSHYRTQVLLEAQKIQAAQSIEYYLAKTGFEAFGNEQAWPALAEHLRGIKDYMNIEDRSLELKNFRETSGKLDVIRAEDTQSILPELAAIWEEKPSWLTRFRSRFQRATKS